MAIKVLDNRDKTELEGKITSENTRATSAESSLSSRIETIENDYLKAADKTTLQTNINTEITNRTNADSALDTRLKQVETFFATADGETLDTALDTLIEIQDYIDEHGEEAATMVNNISANKTAIEAEVTRAKNAESELSTRITTAQTSADNAQTTANQGVSDAAAAQTTADTATTNLASLTERVDSLADAQISASLENLGITATVTELNYCDGVTSNIQEQLDNKALSSHTHEITDVDGLQSALSDKYSSSVSRTANTVLAAPNGSAGSATFRKLVAADLPSHTHSYAGSSSAGGSATSAVKLDSSAGDSSTPVYFSSGKPVACTSLDLNTTGSSASCTGNAATATKLATARTIQTNLASTSSSSFDGSGNITPGVTGTLQPANGGTGVTSTAAIGLIAYPVGAIYISYSSTSPASLFGGTWTQITGRFLRAANDVSTGGSDTNTLTESQLPVVSGQVDIRGRSDSFMSSNAIATGPFSFDAYGDACYIIDGYTSSLTTGYGTIKFSMGGGKSHNNMPAYQDVYVWRRTA